MATARLIPSTYSLSNSSLGVTDADNFYSNTDSTSYGRVSTTSTSSRYIYLKGFNFGAIPSNAVVNSFTVKYKAYETTLSTSSSYYPRLCNNTTTITGTASGALTTSVKTFSFTGVTADWATISGYGSDFAVRFTVRRSGNSGTGYLYLYGVEIEVNYTIPVYHNVTVSNTTSATVTASPSSVLEGESCTVIADTINGIRITDNNTDVTSQFVLHSGADGEYSIAKQGTYGFTLNSNTGYYTSDNKGVNKSCSVCRINFNLPVSATVTFQYINYAEAAYDFGVFGNVDVALTTNYYPAGSGGATISETSYKKACNTSSDNTSSVQTLTYSNVSAGNHFIDVKYSKDDASAANNDTLQFKVTITYNQAVSYYSYIISNVQADHAIVVTAAVSNTIYYKSGNSWVAAVKAYEKVNGSWVEKSDLTTVFNSSNHYVYGGNI